MKVYFGSSTLLLKQYETSSFTHLLSLCCLHCSLLQWCCIFLYQVSPASYDLCFAACSLHFWQIAHLQHTKICKKITSIKTVCYKENELVAVCKAINYLLKIIVMKQWSASPQPIVCLVPIPMVCSFFARQSNLIYFSLCK